MEQPAPLHPLIRTITDRPRRLFAIGDVHGCFDELFILINHLISEQGLAEDDLLLFIGDLIDRGPASREVIEYVHSLKEKWPRTVMLRGNHEDMLLGFLGMDGFGGDVYLPNGGVETLKSYGLNPYLQGAELAALLPPHHIELLQRLEYGVTLAEFLFVHAGVNPHTRLAQQDPHDFMWVRTEFTHAEHSFGKTVVFGHTPFEDIFLHLPFKLGIDTGLVYGNKLTAVELVDGDLYQIDFGEQEVVVSSLRER